MRAGAALVHAIVLLVLARVDGQGKELPMNPLAFRSVEIDGLSIFYREAGPKDAPTLLLPHGLPSSSRMFEPLFARLSNRYQLVAPDYPGFGHAMQSTHCNRIELHRSFKQMVKAGSITFTIPIGTSDVDMTGLMDSVHRRDLSGGEIAVGVLNV
jgi:hypothetical protein